MLALTHAASGDGRSALTWITEARRRYTGETDVYAGMEASILATDAHISQLYGQQLRAEAAARALLTLAARTHQDGVVSHALGLLDIPSW